jgi:hypothetical protein
MNIRILRSHLLVFTGLIMLQCSRDNAESVVLVSYPVNSMEGVISLTDVSLDTAISYDGNGSLEFSAQQPTTFTIYETGDLNVEDCRLIYQAKIRTRNIQGAAYLEMWCHFPGKGEYFSRALNTKLSGDNNWNNQETVFFLKKGENPDNVRLNVVIDGSGTLWIDDISLSKAPL